jgi:hypothetical protein
MIKWNWTWGRQLCLFLGVSYLRPARPIKPKGYLNDSKNEQKQKRETESYLRDVHVRSLGFKFDIEAGGKAERLAILHKIGQQQHAFANECMPCHLEEPSSS